MTKLRFKSDILKSSNKSILYKFFYNIRKCLKIYQPNAIKKIKKDCKKISKRFQNLSKEEKEKKATIWS